MEYQKTSIGEIPVDWDLKEFGDLCNEIHRYPTYYKIEYTDELGSIPEIRGELITNSGELDSDKSKYRHISLETSKKFPRTVVQEGDFVMSVRGTIGKIGMVDNSLEGANITANLLRISPDRSQILPEFMKYLLFSRLFQNRLDLMSSQTTIKTIQVPVLKAIKLPLPNLTEQKRISKILSTVDLAILKSDETIVNTERLKRGIMQKLLTEGIGHNEFKDTSIGMLPAEWEVYPLKKMINLKSGQYFKFSEFTDEGIKCLKIDNVGFGNVEWDTKTYLPESYLEKYSELLLNEGDIVIALNRPIIKNKLKIAFLKEIDSPSILYQRVGKVVFKEFEIDKNYLFYLLKGDYFKNQLSRYLIGTDQPYIRTPVFLGIKIPVPSLSEQQKISKILHMLELKLKSDIKRKEKLQNIKKGLMNDLLTGKKRVKLDNN